MKRKSPWSLLMLLVLISASLTYTRSASSGSSIQRTALLRALPATSSLLLPLTTTFDVDRTDDTAAATACTPAPNDCSLRGAIIAANADVSAIRSERAGNGNGRVYTITFKVADASGNVGTATAKVTVPSSQNGSAAVDGGPVYTVLSGCP